MNTTRAKEIFINFNIKTDLKLEKGAFNLFNRFGHLRMVSMRGKKASVYEGGHRVPFLSWWPKGTHQSLWGTNFDLPVSQIDFFATFAEILKYPLPNGDQVITMDIFK